MRWAVFALLLSACCLATGAKFETEAWRSDIVIAKDRSFTVTETIRVRFTSHQRGLIRHMPYSVRGSEGTRRDVRYSLLGVKANYGHGFELTPVTESYDGNDWQLRIGDPDITRIGRVTYKIAYRVEDGLTDLDIQDRLGKRTELYWNVIGAEWATSIRRVEGSVTFPLPSKGQLAARILVGESGSRKGIELQLGKHVVGRSDLLRGELSKHGLSFRTRGSLSKGDGITVVLGLPKGTLSQALPEPIQVPENPYPTSYEDATDATARPMT